MVTEMSVYVAFPLSIDIIRTKDRFKTLCEKFLTTYRHEKIKDDEYNFHFHMISETYMNTKMAKDGLCLTYADSQIVNMEAIFHNILKADVLVVSRDFASDQNLYALSHLLAACGKTIYIERGEGVEIL